MADQRSFDYPQYVADAWRTGGVGPAVRAAVLGTNEVLGQVMYRATDPWAKLLQGVVTGAAPNTSASGTITRAATTAPAGALPGNEFGMNDRGGAGDITGMPPRTNPAGSTGDQVRNYAVDQFMGGAAPSAAQEAAQQAAVVQYQKSLRDQWLAQQGVPADALARGPVMGNPRDVIAGPRGAAPRAQNAPIELDYSGFGKPGERIFGAATGGSQKLNSFTGAGLPSYGEGKSGAADRLLGRIEKTMDRLSALSRSNNTADLTESKRLQNVLGELRGAYGVAVQHEYGKAQVGEQTRSAKQRERATSAAQALQIPEFAKGLGVMSAAYDPDTLRTMIAAYQGGYPHVQSVPINPLGQLIPGPNGLMPYNYLDPAATARMQAVSPWPTFGFGQ